MLHGGREAIARADLFVLNLERCASDRGHRRREPRKAFFFRAPSTAAKLPVRPQAPPPAGLLPHPAGTRRGPEWIRERFTAACAEFGTAVADQGGRLTVDWR